MYTNRIHMNDDLLLIQDQEDDLNEDVFESFNEDQLDDHDTFSAWRRRFFTLEYLCSFTPMMDKYLYIVDYWVPFPQSEYGGVINVVAKDDQECFDLCRELNDGYQDDHVGHILPKVKNAVRLKVDETEEVGIVSSFTT